MSKTLARLIALALSLALWTTALSIDLVQTAFAEAVAVGAQFDAPEKATPSKAPEQASANEPSPTVKPDAGTAPGETHTASPVPETPDEAPAAAPTQPPLEAPNKTPIVTPTQSPVETPPETPTTAPTQSPSEAPFDTPIVTPTQSPVEMPSETPTAAPQDAKAGAYQVSPGEANFTLGSLDPLMFSIMPPDAPFISVEDMVYAYKNGVVTLPAEALNALGAGERVLAFLFEDGARVEVPLKMTAAKVVEKGTMEYLFIGGKAYYPPEVNENQSNSEQHWAWNAATATVTLDGYDGGRIRARGMTTLTVTTAAGSVNTIAESDEDSLYSDCGLVLTGGGTLNVTNDHDSAILCNESIVVEGGTVRASGGKYAFRSKQNEIRVNGGKVVVKHTGHQGDGFSARSSVRVTGGSVTVEGAAAAFGSLIVSGGSVTIRDSEVGANGGLSASGGDITIEDMTQSAAVSEQAMRFANCALTITGCGQYGLKTGSDLTVGRGANLRVEAERIALYASGRTATIKIEKGANLDLSGGEGALKGGKVVVGGKPYAGAYNHVVIQNGVIVRRENSIQSLTAGGRTYGASLLSCDLAGEGWAWGASGRTLTLNGYDGGAVSAIGCPVSLALQGENRINGDLTVTGAIITGAGKLTVSRIVGKANLEIRSGTVSAENILLGGEFSISGGAVRLSGGAGAAAECGSFNMSGGELTLLCPNASQPAGIRASEAAAIRGGAVTVRNFGDFLQASGDVSIAGGSVWVGDNTGAGIVSGKTIKATGGTIAIQTTLCAMTAKSIVISGKPSLHLESASSTAFSAKSVKIAGKAYKPRYPGVIIEGGRLVEGYKLLPDLVIGDREYFMNELDSGNQSGDGWAWIARKNTLTLSGYHGEGIWINRKITVAMAPGTVNSGSGEAGIHSIESLTLTGSGRFDGGLLCERGLTIAGSPKISASAIRSGEGGVSIFGGWIEVSGGIEAENGDILIENSRVTAGRVLGLRVDLLKSSLMTTAMGDSGGPDLAGERGLAISGSIVFCSQYASPGGKVRLSGSPVFRRGSSGGEEVWTLAQSATISRSMTIPPGKDCLVPAGRTLSIAKGKRLYIYGSFAVEGTLKGTAVRRSEAGKVNILGGAQVARGKSVRLSAQVVPVIPDGQADQAVSWSSDSPKILTVSDKGVVSASALSKPGDTAEITCRALDGTGVEATVLMTVTEPVKKLTILRDGVTVTRSSASRSTGQVELTVRADPEGASSRVRWTSSNPAIASVDPDTGTVRLLKKGTATIACAATDGTNVKAIVSLTVK